VNWDAEAARDRLQQFVIETFGAQDAIGVGDETGLLKKGEHSGGVPRQYSGAAGKIENCQVATVLSYASRAGHVFLDRRLSLPQEEWCWQWMRRAKAKVPKEVHFQTKPEQAIAMLEHGWRAGRTDAVGEQETRSMEMHHGCGKRCRSTGSGMC
jgi:SRSO17 transposase